jgi:hypothetical protein
MKPTAARFSRRYVMALRKHLKGGPGESFVPAARLGRAAVAGGLETLEMARIHEGALATLELSDSKNAAAKRADLFFTEAITPIVETHRAARESRVKLKHLTDKLSRRTMELAATNRQLKKGVARREVMKDAIAKSVKAHKTCIQESLLLQTRLRHLTHRVRTAHERDSSCISHQLRDEIAQTLLGINVRLLSLQQEARQHRKGFKKSVASTQRLLVNSVKTVQRAIAK